MVHSGYTAATVVMKKIGLTLNVRVAATCGREALGVNEDSHIRFACSLSKAAATFGNQAFPFARRSRRQLGRE